MSYDIKLKHADGFFSACDLNVVKDTNGNKQLKCINLWLGRIITFFWGPKHTINILDQVIQDTAKILKNETTQPTLEELENIKGNLNSIIRKYATNPSAQKVDSLMQKKLNVINQDIEQCNEKIKENIEHLLNECQEVLDNSEKAESWVYVYLQEQLDEISILAINEGITFQNHLKQLNTISQELVNKFKIEYPEKATGFHSFTLPDFPDFYSNKTDGIVASLHESKPIVHKRGSLEFELKVPKALVKQLYESYRILSDGQKIFNNPKNIKFNIYNDKIKQINEISKKLSGHKNLEIISNELEKLDEMAIKLRMRFKKDNPNDYDLIFQNPDTVSKQLDIDITKKQWTLYGLMGDSSKIIESCKDFLNKPSKDKIIIDDYFDKYKQLVSIIKELGKFKNIKDIKIRLNEVNAMLLEIQKDFNKMYPSKRLFVCGNDFFIADEAFFIRQSTVEQARANSSWKDHSPGFIVHAPKSLDSFLKNPDKFKIDKENFQDLLAFSHEFDMPILKEKCDEFLMGQIDALEKNEKEMLGDLYDLATTYELPKSSKQLLALPLSRFPKSSQPEIQIQKKAPPAFKKYSYGEMIESLVSTKIGSDVQLKVGEEIWHVDSKAFRTLSSGMKDIELKDISPQAAKSLIEYAYYGAIETISPEVFAELWMYTLNNGVVKPELDNVQQYLENRLIDYIPLEKMGEVINKMDLNKNADFVNALLKYLEAATGFSLKVENEGIEVVLTGPFTKDKLLLIEGLSSRIKNLKMNQCYMHFETTQSFFLKCTNVESFDAEWKDFNDNHAILISSLPSIKKLHLNILNNGGLHNFAPYINLPHLESLTYLGKYFPNLRNLLDQNTLSHLKELKIPCISKPEIINDFLDQCPLLESLEVYANSLILNSVFAKAHKLKHLNIVKGDENILGWEVLNYVKNKTDLSTLNIDPSCIKHDVRLFPSPESIG